MDDLFPDSLLSPPRLLAPGATLLAGQALAQQDAIWQAVERVLQQAPLRRMQTPGGHTMSVAMSNCGQLGWISDQRGYRYSGQDPASGLPWPALPPLLADLAGTWAATAGFADFHSNACLINCYEPGSRMSLHQDRDERDFTQPIVTLSLGLAARFMLGGAQRQSAHQKIVLRHGDVLVFGGPAACAFTASCHWRMAGTRCWAAGASA
ncbi:alpha-ketoglutarate-dependent dioxygenase AlkB [Aquitalea magnusonii]|uniref:alpha-ketoglutarate-dependent dioxygenase AlkB n=1 Tax=Aquitalea magnusonii TaxID=332411 RepID=UPI000A4937BE|nr:alpha-ketoglutarate-dependent dioxygenase AlkB [Aquitalea magnusonii]